MTLYDYTAVVLAIHDGDTFTLDVDLGFQTHHIGVFRLARCNARELKDPGGIEARDNLKVVMPVGAVVRVSTIKPDKFGERYDTEVTLPDGRNLTDLLVSLGWLALWNGTGTKPVPPWPRPQTEARSSQKGKSK